MGIETIPTGVQTGVPGSLLGTPVVNAVPGLGSVVLAAGTYSLYAVGANITYQVQDNAGVWNNVTAAGASSPLIYSDGTNYRLSNSAGVSQNATTVKIG